MNNDRKSSNALVRGLMWLRTPLGFLFGPIAIMWFIYTVLYPALIALFPIHFFGMTYDNYKIFLARSVRIEQHQLESYQWQREERAYDVADAQIVAASLGLLAVPSELTPLGGISGPPDGRTDSFFALWDEVFGNLHKFVNREWIPINRAFFLIIGLRFQMWAVPLLMIILMAIGCFCAGEYASRDRFERNVPPSSGRTEIWLNIRYFGGSLLLNLPAMIFPFSYPFMWVGLFGSFIVLYAVYQARTESIEYV